MAVLAAAVWCFYPATAVLQVAYSEAIAATLLAGSLLLLTHRRYLLATVLVLALGFTRGIAAPLGVVVVVHLYLRWREERASSRPWLHGQRTSALVLVAGTALSAVAWPVVVGLASGRLDAFFVIQARWGQEPGRGPFVAWVTWAWDRLGIVGVLVLLGLVASYVALVTGRHGRWLSVELRAWALAYPLFLLAVTRPITSMWRFLLLDFPLAAILVSITVRGADGLAVLPTWPRRLLLVCGSLLVGIGAWTVVLLTYTPWRRSVAVEDRLVLGDERSDRRRVVRRATCQCHQLGLTGQGRRQVVACRELQRPADRAVGQRGPRSQARRELGHCRGQLGGRHDRGGQP